MKKTLSLIVAIVLLLVFAAYMITFQVRYDQVAVLTTFDSAVAPTYAENGTVIDAGSLRGDAGLHFKFPWPVQKVYTYSRKLQLLESEFEEIQTADGKSVVIRMFLTWQIQDPLSFFRALGTTDKAETQLRSLLRNLEGVITAYNFNQLVNNDSDQLKLEEIEDKLLAQLKHDLAQIKNPSYGISVQKVGIRRLLLPESTTQAVFDRMKSTRQTLAEQARAEGRAQAATIESDAQSARDRIMAFAQRRAEAIRAQGDREAASYYKAFGQDESFAKFLRQIRTMKQTLSNNSTFIVDSSDLEMLDILRRGPSVAEGMNLGKPGSDPGDGSADGSDTQADSSVPMAAPRSSRSPGSGNTANTANTPNTTNASGGEDQ